MPKAILLAIAGIFLLPFVFVATSAALGLALSRPSSGLVLLVLLLVAYLLPHVLVLSEDRFHLVLVPFLAILAAHVWTSGRGAFVTRWRESLVGKIALSIGVLAVVLLSLNWGLELSRDADKITALLGPGGNHTYFPY